MLASLFMIYELHITVDHNRGPSLRRWQEVCEALEAKPLDIRLDAFHAKNPQQVMFAAVHEGDDATANTWQHQLMEQVTGNGFSIERIKLEVPLDKSAPYANPVYHECHVKALLPHEAADGIVDIAHQAGWLCSWNELFPDDAGLEKWYFTQRSYSKHFIQAGRDFAEVFADLTTYTWHTVRMESETVIYDSNPALDEGWA